MLVLAIDTALDAPDDIVPWRSAPAVPAGPYRAGARSVAMLYALTRPEASGSPGAAPPSGSEG